MDRFPTPPDPPEDVACCQTCKFFCYPEELIPGGCAHCGGELQTEDLLEFWRNRPNHGHWTPFDYNYVPVEWKDPL